MILSWFVWIHTVCIPLLPLLGPEKAEETLFAVAAIFNWPWTSLEDKGFGPVGMGRKEKHETLQRRSLGFQVSLSGWHTLWASKTGRQHCWQTTCGDRLHPSSTV